MLAQPDLDTLREQEIAQMGDITPNVSVTYGELGTPTFIRSTTAFLSRRSTAAPLDIAAAFVNDNPALFGVPFPAASDYRSLRNYVTPGLGVRHITLQQRHGGQDVFGSLLTANITTDGMLVNIGSSFLPMPAGLTGAPACGARNAIAAACDAMDDDRLEDLLALVPEATECTTDWAVGQSVGVGSATGGMFVQAVLYPVSATEIVQAWDVRLPYRGADGGAQWQCVVAHSDGSLLMSRNLVQHFCQPDPVTLKVFPGDSPVPGTPGLAEPVTSGDSECVMRGVNSPCDQSTLGDGRVLLSVEPNQYSPQGWINDGNYARCADFHSGAVVQTCGNNTWVWANSLPNRWPVLGTNVPGREFAPGLDWSDGTAQTLVGVVNAFYAANEWHDRTYALGFDEAAGNFQQVNFTGQGLGGDAMEVRTDAPGSGYGANGAFWDGRAEDGRPYRIEYSGGAGGRLSAYDRTVVFHELTHAMAVRLHAQYFIGHPEAHGLSEGWADYLALALTHEPGDSPHDTYPVFSWAARPNGSPLQHYYFGARTYPYSYHPGINPLTYGFIDPGVTAPVIPFPPVPILNEGGIPRNPHNLNPVRTEAHFVGQVWCNMLVNCRRELAVDLADADAANEIMLQLVIDGMKLDPGSPTFIEARDAILQADVLRYGGVHHHAIWDGFWLRGLGHDARGVPGGSTRGVIEGFEARPPGKVSIFYPEAVPLTIETCRPTSIDALIVSSGFPLVDVRANAEPNPTPLNLPRPLSPVAPGLYRLSLPGAPCEQSWRLWFEATEAGPAGNVDTIGQPHTVTAGQSAVVFADSMETTTGWTTAMDPPYPPGSLLTAGAWALVDPRGGYVYPTRDHSSGAGHLCFVTEDGPQTVPTDSRHNDVDSDGLGVALTSPPFEVPPETTVIIEFWQWFVDRDRNATGPQPAPSDQEFFVEWLQGAEPPVIVEVYGPAHSAPRWQRRRVTVPSSIGEGTARVRFRCVDPPPDTTVEGGIDDVVIYVIDGCEECCDGDLNQDGNQDTDDVSYLAGVVAGGENPTGVDPDFNRDGNVDQDDVAALLNYNAGAGCP
ncbi:MAG: hypothetical protein DYG92_08370 [Leptolyngbya sp. PLA1]|nr:hypothetical protein [Leptolyngbya sp. PLA1]